VNGRRRLKFRGRPIDFFVFGYTVWALSFAADFAVLDDGSIKNRTRFRLNTPYLIRSGR